MRSVSGCWKRSVVDLWKNLKKPLEDEGLDPGWDLSFLAGGLGDPL